MQLQPGRPSTLTDSELLTILIWDGLCEPHKNLSGVYDWIVREYGDYFPRLPKYQNFNEHDNQAMEHLVNSQTKLLVGDSHYGGSVMRKRLWKRYKTVVIAPPHHTQRKKLATDWQILLLHLRPKIEATFGKLKEQRFLGTK